MLRPPFPRFFYNTQTTPTTNAPLNNNTYVFVSPAPPPTNALGLERSHSPHSVDGSTAPRPRRKNRERRGTENSLPGTLNALEVRNDLRKVNDNDKKQETTPDQEVPEPVKDLPTLVSEPTTPTAAATPTRKEPKTPAQSKMEPSPDYQVPFPQVPDPTTRAKRSGDKEREQAALRSPTLSAHSNTSGSHTTAPTTASTANTSAGAITIPGAYDSGSASGGSGLETTPTRETVAKAKRGSAGSASGNSNNERSGGGSNPPSQAGFYPQQQLAQHLPPNPSPIHQQVYRATPPPPSTGSPQSQPAIRTAQAGSSPSQPARQAYAPPPPPMGSGSTTGSIDSFDTPSLQTTRSYPTTAATTNSLPTLPDSPPPPDAHSPPFIQQHLGPGPAAPPTLSSVANLIQAQPVPISPVHPRPQHRTQASVLGPTKMQESWTAVPPPEELVDEVQDRKDHMRSPRDGAALRGHRGTGGGSMDFKDNNPVASWAQQQQQQQQQPERQGSIRRPKVVTQSSTNGVPQQPQPQPPMTRNATMPITTRYETLSPPPIHQHSGLHLDLYDGVGKMPEKPQPAPAPPRIQTGRGPSPSPNLRGRQPAPAPPAPAANTPPYSYEDPYRGRSGSHASFAQQQQPPRAPPPVQQPQWGTRAPGGIVPFNEDLDHDEHEHEPVPPPVHQQQRPADQAVMDWANHTQSQHPLSHPNQPPVPAAPPRGRSRSRGRGDQTQVQQPLMDPSTMFQQQQQQQYQPPPPQHRSPEVNGRPGGRSPLPAPSAGHGHGSGSGSSEAEDLKTPRSPSVPLPGDNNNAYGQRFGGYNQFSVGPPPPTVNHIYTQDLGHNGHGQMYPSMGFAQSQQMLQQMGAGPQGMHYMNGRQMNGRDQHHHQQYNYGYPQDLSSSASGSFLDGWTSNQLDSRGYPNHIRPSAPIPPTPSSGTGPSVVSGDIRNGQPAHMARAQTVMYNHQQQQYQQPYNYGQQYAMDPYRAPSVVSSFMASPFSHNPFLPPAEPQSTQSSPSHQPVGLPYGGKRFGGARMGTKSMGRRRRMMEEFRPESTVPNDTASEAETEAKRAPDGAETEFETETEMEEVWLEESDDDELENEFHSTYFVNPAKRKRRFEQKWEQMVKLFREIDRETDATMILAAAPPDQHQTHLLLSRSILRDTNFSHVAQEARSVFSDITVARRHQRAEALRRARQERQRKKVVDDRLSAVAHLTLAAGGDNVGSGSDETSVPTQQGEQDLRVALDAARSSLQEMRRVYDEMEARHREESNRRKEESLSLEKLLTSLLASKTVQPSSSS
ncbi:hypothetical protein FRC11_013780 [Ceratobasidium sp. 423]|nr:hypothetical protein FRC11_013780 [Ceratobasidium sp. 423]